MSKTKAGTSKVTVQRTRPSRVASGQVPNAGPGPGPVRRIPPGRHPRVRGLAG